MIDQKERMETRKKPKNLSIEKREIIELKEIRKELKLLVKRLKNDGLLTDEERDKYKELVIRHDYLIAKRRRGKDALKLIKAKQLYCAITNKKYDKFTGNIKREQPLLRINGVLTPDYPSHLLRNIKNANLDEFKKD